jgi:hypothetical protein
MGVRKKGPSFCEPVDTRSFGVKVSAETACPVVEVVNGDEKYIRLLSSFAGFVREKITASGNGHCRCSQAGSFQKIPSCQSCHNIFSVTLKMKSVSIFI